MGAGLGVPERLAEAFVRASATTWMTSSSGLAPGGTWTNFVAVAGGHRDHEQLCPSVRGPFGELKPTRPL